MEEKKKTICHICPSFNNPLYQLLFEEQMKLGNSIRVFYFRQKGTGLPNGEKDYVDGVMPFSFIDRFFFFEKERKVRNAFDNFYKDKKFDLIHAHTLFTSGYIAYKLYLEKRIPYIVAVRGSDVNVFFKKRIHLRNIGIKILSNASKIIFLSNTHKNEVLNKYVPNNIRTIIERKTIVIPNGINDFWHVNKTMKTRICNPENIGLIYYGDINANKNLETTVDAMKILEKMGYKVSFKVIGAIKDSKRKRLLKKAKGIEYYPFSPKEVIIKHLRQADIFVMPSFSETFGLSYVEAMSQGIPVIYSRGQGFDKYFEDGIVGYGVNPADACEIAKKILMILNRYDIISKSCLEKSSFFKWSNIAAMYQKIYDE